MRTHPPLFNALTNRLGPHHAANVLARKIAHREDNGRLLAKIAHLTQKHAPYYPPGWSDSHEMDHS